MSVYFLFEKQRFVTPYRNTNTNKCLTLSTCDKDRRERFLASLPKGAQVIVTTTNAGWLGEGMELEVREVSSGSLL